MVRRALAEQNACFACFKLVVSLARSKALIAAFNERSPLSCFFGRRNLVFIVERQGGREKAVRRRGRPEGEAGPGWKPSHAAAECLCTMPPHSTYQHMQSKFPNYGYACRQREDALFEVGDQLSLAQINFFLICEPASQVQLVSGCHWSGGSPVEQLSSLGVRPADRRSNSPSIPDPEYRWSCRVNNPSLPWLPLNV